MGGNHMRSLKKLGLGVAAAAFMAVPMAAQAEVDFGKPGEKVDLVIGYQPYYTESWSGVVNNGKQFWKKYLPEGSTAEFQIGLQGSSAAEVTASSDKSAGPTAQELSGLNTCTRRIFHAGTNTQERYTMRITWPFSQPIPSTQSAQHLKIFRSGPIYSD